MLDTVSNKAKMVYKEGKKEEGPSLLSQQELDITIPAIILDEALLSSKPQENKSLKDILREMEVAKGEDSESKEGLLVDANEWQRILDYEAQMQSGLDYGSLFSYLDTRPIIMYDSSYEATQKVEEEVREMDEFRFIEMTQEVILSGIMTGYTQRDEKTANISASAYERESYTLFKTIMGGPRMMVLNDIAERFMAA